MSTETLDAPPETHAAADDSADLIAQFNSSLSETKAARGEATEQPADTSKPAPAESKAAPVDDGIPEQFIKGKAPEAEQSPEDKDKFLSEEPPKEVKGSAREAFKNLQKQADLKIKTLAQQAADLQKQLAERTDSKPSEDHQKALQAERERAASLEQELERAAYERSPKFQKFDKDVSAEIAAAKSYLEGSEVNPSVLDAAASVTGQQRAKILRESGLEPDTIALVSANLARADAIRRERDASLTDWKGARDREAATQQEQQAAAERQQVEAEKAVWEKVRAEMEGKHPAYTKVAGNDAWNATIEANEKRSQDFAMGKMPLEELFRIGRLGVGAETVDKINAGLTKRLEAAHEELARLKAAQPGTGHSIDTKAGGEPRTEKEGYIQNFDNALAGLRQ